MKRCKVKDVTYSYIDEGEGEVVLLLHGFTGNKETWVPFMKKWSHCHRVIAIDLLGHGETSAPIDVEPYHMECLVDDVAHLLNLLDIKKVHLLGYSMGGRIAIAFASTHPEMIHSLILESCTPGIEEIDERKKRQLEDEKRANFIEEKGIESFVYYWENISLFAPLQKRLSEQEKRNLRIQRLQNNSIGLANSLRGTSTGKQSSYWGNLTEFTFPTLLICGEEDKKFCEIMKRMTKHIQNVEFCKISQASHVIHMEQFQNFDTIVSEFLQKGEKKNEY